MAPNKSLIFKQVPKGAPVPGQDLTIEDRPVDLDAAPPSGFLLIQILEASIDPYMRGMMRAPEKKSYAPPFTLDAPIPAAVVARVLKSSAEGFAAGDLVRAYAPIAQYAVVPAQAAGKIANPHGLDLGHFVGALGMTGVTAYSSLYKIGKPNKGDTIFVSSAAGAVGQIVGQLAKHEGMRVIGSVGSDEKLDFIIKELGFDGGFNYKTEKAADALKRLAPEGLDIYYENVGGEQLDAALENMKDYGRVIVCGLISQYNAQAGEAYAVKNFKEVLSRRLLIQGFVQRDPGYADTYGKEHQEKVGQWLADGTFKAKLSVTEGIDHAAEGLVGMLEGKNFGKAVIRISDP